VVAQAFTASQREIKSSAHFHIICVHTNLHLSYNVVVGRDGAESRIMIFPDCSLSFLAAALDGLTYVLRIKNHRNTLIVDCTMLLEESLTRI
jgi:hypothetical protein